MSPDEFAAAAGDDVEGRARRVGLRRRADRRAAGDDRLHDLHARARSRACRSTSSARCRCPATDDPRSSATRSTGSSPACSASSASRPIRCRAASTSCSPTSSSTRGRRARRSTSPTLVGMVQQPPIRKLGVFELDQFFPPDDRMKLAMKLNGLLASPAFAAWGAGQPLDIQSLLYTPDGTGPLRDRHDGPPVRRGAPVRHVARAGQARHVDAPPERHDRPAGAAVHGRGRRLPAADGQPADEAADHAADEAGPGVRRRRRAVDAEPGRRRLQGDVQRRHVDGRAAADRPGQAAPARRDERGGRRRRRRRGRRHDQRPGQARVRAAPGRQGPARGVHDPVGDELPARPDDARPDPAADGAAPSPRPRRRRRRRPPPAPARRRGRTCGAAPAAAAAATDPTSHR